MGNCLVTKLNGVVSDNSLPRLGKIHLIVSRVSSFTPTESNTRIYLQVPSGEQFTVSCTNGNHLATTFAGLSNPSNSVDYTGTGLYLTLFFDNGDYDIFISNKYKQAALWYDNNSRLILDLSELSFAERMNRVSLTNNSKTKGDLSAVEALNNLGEFNVNGALGVTGDIKHLPASIVRTILFGTSVTRTVEGFVAAQIAKGRATCTTGDGVRFWDILAAATFGGIKHNLPIVERAVYWSSASKIWIKGGGYVVAKGATAEEIAEWEQQGNTVIVVD